MATASIAVSVKAKTAAFNKKVRQSGKNVQSFGARIRRVAKGIAKFGTALTAVAAAGMAIFIKQSFATLDALAKVSSRLDISADKLRGLERAASLTGSSVETLRKGLTRMSANVAEVATGTGEAKVAFEELGLDAAKLVKLKPDEIFLSISKALKDIPNSVRQIGLVGDIFGLRGIELLNTLKLGDVELRKMLATSVRLSGSFSDLDLSMIERANDAFADMKRAIRSIADRLAIVFSGPVAALADKISDWAVRLRGSLVTTVIPAVKAAIVDLLNFLDKGLRAIGRLVFTIAADMTEAFAHFPGDAGIAFAKMHRKVVEASGVTKPAHLGGRELLGNRMAKGLEETMKKVQLAVAQDALKAWVAGIRHEFKFFEVVFTNPMKIFAEHMVSLGKGIDEGLKRTAAKQALTPAAVAAAPRRAAQFMQVSPSLIHIPGMTAAGKQSVQDITAHGILTKIAANTQGGSVARFAP